MLFRTAPTIIGTEVLGLARLWVCRKTLPNAWAPEAPGICKTSDVKDACTEKKTHIAKPIGYLTCSWMGLLKTQQDPEYLSTGSLKVQHTQRS